MIVLLLGLVLAALVAVVAWLGTREPESAHLPCPPGAVAVAYSPADAPSEVREAVEEALRDAGREVTEGGYGPDQSRDLVVSWWTVSDPGPPSVGGSSPATLRLEEVPSAEGITEALGDHLAPCTAAEPTQEPTAAPEATQDDEDGSTGISWPWERGWSPVALLALAVITWWIAGPQVIRWTWAALWPARLAWRTEQRWAYRRRLTLGYLPAEWPERIEPGQRWHEDDAAMHDKQTYRRQIADTEPERRAEMRERLREERLRGEGIGPASLWRVIYRVPDETTDVDDAPTEGAPEGEGASR